jgi:D-alanyl-D-alanine dipeptidase
VRARRFIAAMLSFAFLLGTRASFGDSAKKDCPLINVKELAPGIMVEMRYATTNNFTGKQLYPVADECLLCEPAAERLARVQKDLEKKGLGLKVWDCYRPVSVQQKLWDVVPDPRYVADPKTGSRHNRGASVDLTLVDSHGKELTMPTGFDDFSERAHRTFMDLPAEALKNRALLQSAMEQEGFIGLPSEWWHFDEPSWGNFALRDEPLGSSSLHADINVNIRQLIVVTSKSWQDTTGRLQRYEKKNGAWVKVGDAWTVSLGLNGMAWGRGLRSGDSGPRKKEGDNTAPAGMFRIGKAYGYDAALPSGSQWPYQQVDETWRCIDDPASACYNKIFAVDASVKKDWSSAELMRRSDHLYKWVLNVEQNQPSKAGAGSCIFLHVWRKPLSSTEGCTAMPEEKMVELLQWLRPELEPHLVQLPEEEYRANKRNWELP